MELKDRLKRLRTQSKISLAELASLFSKSESAIRMWEIGRSKPDADTLIKLAKYFGCTADYLLGLDDYPDREKTGQVIELEKSQMKVLHTLNGSYKENYYHLNRYILDIYALAQKNEKALDPFVSLTDYLELLSIFYMTRHDIYPKEHFKEIKNKGDKIRARIETAFELKHDINFIIHELLELPNDVDSWFEIDYEKYINFWN